MNRIYYQGSFKLATDWPEEPKPNAFGRVHLLREDSYLKAVGSVQHLLKGRKEGDLQE